MAMSESKPYPCATVSGVLGLFHIKDDARVRVGFEIDGGQNRVGLEFSDDHLVTAIGQMIAARSVFPPRPGEVVTTLTAANIEFGASFPADCGLRIITPDGGHIEFAMQREVALDLARRILEALGGAAPAQPAQRMN
jgi:hypothetical protein